MAEISRQILLACLFYGVVLILFRLGGKRLAGQTTTFDLIVMISLVVAVEQNTLLAGGRNVFIFVFTVFLLHWSLAHLCARSAIVRRFLRGAPVSLIQNGRIIHSELHKQGLSEEELRAGLRKQGIDNPAKVNQAHLEETGEITVIR